MQISSSPEERVLFLKDGSLYHGVFKGTKRYYQEHPPIFLKQWPGVKAFYSMRCLWSHKKQGASQLTHLSFRLVYQISYYFLSEQSSLKVESWEDCVFRQQMVVRIRTRSTARNCKPGLWTPNCIHFTLPLKLPPLRVSGVSPCTVVHPRAYTHAHTQNQRRPLTFLCFWPLGSPLFSKIQNRIEKENKETQVILSAFLGLAWVTFEESPPHSRKDSISSLTNEVRLYYITDKDFQVTF